MAAESRRAVVAAIVGNALIAAAKCAAAAYSGSAAMLAEAIHSLVDAGNDGLMLYGMRRSRRPPDEAHPLGYGHELYFWTLIVGVVIFALGGGMSVVTGVSHILDARPRESVGWNYAVIGVAFVFESVSWWYGVKAFRAERRGRGIVETVRVTKDPTTFSVLLEDSAALVGLALALAGIALAEALGAPWIDGASSVLIGVLLSAIALVMVGESKGLLVGEGVEQRTLETLRKIVAADPAVERVDRLLTQYLGPNEVLLAIELRFRLETDVTDIRRALARLKQEIQSRYPKIRRILLDSSAIER
jgi:cation diffusion facilitator family transporter